MSPMTSVLSAGVWFKVEQTVVSLVVIDNALDTKGCYLTFETAWM